MEVDESEMDVECREGGVVKFIAKEMSSVIDDDIEIDVSFLSLTIRSAVFDFLFPLLFSITYMLSSKSCEVIIFTIFTFVLLYKIL